MTCLFFPCLWHPVLIDLLTLLNIPPSLCDGGVIEQQDYLFSRGSQTASRCPVQEKRKRAAVPLQLECFHHQKRRSPRQTNGVFRRRDGAGICSPRQGRSSPSRIHSRGSTIHPPPPPPPSLIDPSAILWMCASADRLSLFCRCAHAPLYRQSQRRSATAADSVEKQKLLKV